MPKVQRILLTGATGLIGRYLLRDMLLVGHRVAVLARDTAPASAQERIAELVAFWSEALGRALPRPLVLAGDLTLPGLGLGLAERRRLGRNRHCVLHCAANMAHRTTAWGEPWETNVNGTRRLLDLIRSTGIETLHHVSTAFVYGSRRSILLESELDLGSGPNNAYEHSKYEAERLLRHATDVRTTVYRPSVVVGDSRTGFTSSYHHFYRFLELAVRLSSPACAGRPGLLPLRLPLTGDETQNLVCVDWVARAIVRLMSMPRWHGRTYHLVARRPLLLRRIKAIIEELLHIEAFQWAGEGGHDQPTALEQSVLEQFSEYWTYMRSSPIFESANLRRALPDLSPPAFGLKMAARLLKYAQADNWGRRLTKSARGSHSFRLRGRALGNKRETLSVASCCSRYVEHFLPQRASRSVLVQALPLGLSFGLDIAGSEGGQWTCSCPDGKSLRVDRGLHTDTVASFRMDEGTFVDLVSGSLPPQEAFFEGRVEIEGDVEKGLKLAALFERFFAENPFATVPHTEVPHEAGSRRRRADRNGPIPVRPVPA